MANAKSNWLLPAVVLLAAINLVTLGFLWFGRHNPYPPEPRPPHRDAREFLVSELKLDPAQTAQFDSLRKIHFATVDALREDMHRLKDQLFERLPRSDGAAGIADSIGAVQTKIEQATFDHFHALRQICTPQQQQKFDGVIRNVLRTMAPPDGPPPPRVD